VAAGHTTFATAQDYVREAEPLRKGFGVVLPVLDPLVLPPVTRGSGSS
jgi:hypothetical protein